MLSVINCYLFIITSNSNQSSPFEIVFGRQMRINAPVKPETVLPFSGDKRRYYDCLAKEMKRLHQAVKERKEEIKLQAKAVLVGNPPARPLDIAASRSWHSRPIDVTSTQNARSL